MRTLLLVGLLVGTAVAGAAERKLLLVGGGEAVESAARAALEEVLLQAKFLGIAYDFQTAEPGDVAAHADADAVFAAIDPEVVAEALPGVPVFNVASGDNELRTRCRPNLLHTAPSEAMLADAAAQWKQAHPDAADIEARAWHADFVKFAGRELNNRWGKKTGRSMTDLDWSVWVAIKMVGDAIANNPDASGEELIAYFRDEMEFDGQKGDYVTFRETGQLRQPLLVTVGGELAGEAPVRGVSSDLDSLGPQACK